jgi:outer membrane protein assembly factor BamE (lipoprotein component of BamABCDE complex)
MKSLAKILLLLCSLLPAPACVSTGVPAITDSGLTSKLEADKSTKAEVTALLGFPAIVTYGDQGRETWNYYYVTEYPKATDFIPGVNAAVHGFPQDTRMLTITFDRRGVAQDLQRRQVAGTAAVFPY